MSFREKDFLKRIVERMASFIASVLGRRRQVDPQVLLQEVQREKEDLLGMPVSVLDALAPSSVRELLGDDEAVAAYRSLVELEAELLADAGREDEAALARARAASF